MLEQYFNKEYVNTLTEKEFIDRYAGSMFFKRRKLDVKAVYKELTKGKKKPAKIEKGD